MFIGDRLTATTKLGVVNRSRTCPAVYFTTEWPSPTLLHKLGAPNRNQTCLRLAITPERNQSSA